MQGAFSLRLLVPMLWKWQVHCGPSYPHCRLMSCYHLLFAIATCILVNHNRTGTRENGSHKCCFQCGRIRLESAQIKIITSCTEMGWQSQQTEKSLHYVFLRCCESNGIIKKGTTYHAKKHSMTFTLPRQQRCPRTSACLHSSVVWVCT